MPVHNNAAYLDEAIRSILGQTFGDFELIVLENGSRDGSLEILRRWAARDERIRLVEEAQALGIAGSSNAATRLARAPLVARMDADDVSLPERFARQVPAIQARPDTVLVAALAEGMDERGHVVRPPDSWFLMRPSVRPPFTHGSIIYRREAFERVGGYRGPGAWADVDFFQRLGEAGRLAVLAETLYRYRFTAGSTTSGAGVRETLAANAERRATVDARVGRRELPRRRLDGAALYEREAMRLWAGHRPALLGLLFRERLVAPTPRGLALLGWALVAAACPGVLRRVQGATLSLRERLARGLLAANGAEDVVYWRFG